MLTDTKINTISFDLQTMNIFLPGEKLSINFSRSEETKKYFFLLLVLAKHTITNELEEPVNIKDIKSDTVKLCRKLGLAQKRFPQSTASYRFLCLKFLDEQYQLNSKCPYEIVHVESQCILPFRVEYSKYEKYTNTYKNILQSHINSKCEEDANELNDIADNIDSFRGHFSDIFINELQFLMSFIEVSENNGNVFLRIDFQGKDVILPKINISSKYCRHEIFNQSTIQRIWTAARNDAVFFA